MKKKYNEFRGEKDVFSCKPQTLIMSFILCEPENSSVTTSVAPRSYRYDVISSAFNLYGETNK